MALMILLVVGVPDNEIFDERKLLFITRVTCQSVVITV